MAEKILLEVVTPDKLLLSKEVDVVVATGSDGEFGVLHGHVPFLASLAIGELRYRVDGQEDYASVAGGFAEVTPEKVTILAEAAELAREIDVDRAQRAKERAEKRIAQSKADQLEYTRAEIALQRAMLRMRLVSKLSGGGE